MLGLKIKTTSASIFVLVLGLLNTAATCNYKVRDTEVCSVAGVMAAGMDCAHTRTDETRSMTLDQTLEFLEPRIGSKGSPERAGAMCMSADDYTKQKTDLESICRMLGDRCSYEVKQAIAEADRRLTALQKRTIKKAVRRK